MTVLSVAYPLMQVGPGSGGGAEQILCLLERGILAAGHRSLVIAAAESEVAGELLETPAFSGEITEEIRAEAQRVHRARIEEALARYTIDLIHFHGLDLHAYLPSANVPMLATLHLPLAWYPPDIFHLPDVALNCVSHAQAASAPPGKTPAVVCNGIDTCRYGGTWRKRELLLWLGRICPEKGVHIALDVARRLDLPMIVAGPVHPFRTHEAYYAGCVQPLLDDKRRYAGPVDLAQKIDLLARARCLLIPSLAPETSSLVAMEAAASGTPVAAFRTGALPEVVEHGVTGFIADSTEEMAEYVKKAAGISPDTCRKRAHSRFSAERMRHEYLALYDRVISTLHFGTGSAPHANL
jgi:glycosyltransferase involved in cell wall biosynthesis